MRSFLLLAFLCSFVGFSQSTLQKQISSEHIEIISINGNQIFNITISASKTDEINVISILDGEYQNDFQVVIRENNHTLNLQLEHLSLTEIPDDKRNAHKVIAATLHLEIPEHLTLHITSDIGSVDLKGNFKSLFVELHQGHFNFEGKVKTGSINTLDGDIKVVTDNATVIANSNHGKINLDELSDPISSSISAWTLKSINGNITVVKPD